MLTKEQNTAKMKFRQAAEIFFISEVQNQPLALRSSKIPCYAFRLPFWPFSTPAAATLRDQHHHHPCTTDMKKLEVFENFDRKINTSCDDLYHCLRPLLIIAKLFGIFPIQGVFSNNSKKIHNLKFKWISSSTIISALICCSLFILSGIGFLNFFKDYSGRHQHGKAETIKHIIFETRAPIVSGVGALLYTLFLAKSPDLLKLFIIWIKSSDSLMLKGYHPRLFKQINIVGFTILAPGIIHSQLLVLSRFDVFGGANTESEDPIIANITRSESYYSRYGLDWDGLPEYNGALTCFLCIIWNFATFALIFCDIFIITMSILLYKKFEGLIAEAGIQLSYYRRKSSHRLLLFRKTSIESIARNHLWSQIRRDHLICMHLVWKADEMLSPFIFISFATSIYFICIQMYQGVTLAGNRGSYTEAILSGFLLTSLLTRVILVSLMGARVHEKGLEISHCVQKCPNGFYGTELERLERMLSQSNLIGITGLGCFIVNKALLIVIGSVIFTFEIVLFQASANSLRVESSKSADILFNSTLPN